MAENTVRRRTYLKSAATALAASGLAGCTQGLGGGSGGGTQTIRVTLGPGGFQGPVVDYITNRTSILEDKITSAGNYEVEVKSTWKGKTLFASGGPDFAGFGPLEAAKLASERDLNLAVNAKVAPNFVTWWTKRGGPYDPQKTGSVQESFDKMYRDGARHAHGSWGSGHVDADKYIHKEIFSHTFEEGGDLDVVTSSYATIPKLIEQGELDSGAGWFNANTQQMKDPPALTSLYTAVDILRENNLGTNTLNSWVSTQEFADNNAAAVKAFLEAWQEGMNWLFSKPMQIFMNNTDYREQIKAETKEEARWSVKWALLDDDVGPRSGVVYQDISMSDQWIDANKRFIDNVAALGQVIENWQDYIEYRKVL